MIEGTNAKELRVPSSKSLTHRYFNLAVLARKPMKSSPAPSVPFTRLAACAHTPQRMSVAVVVIVLVRMLLVIIGV